MKKQVIALFVIAFILAFIAAATAQTKTPVISETQKNEKARIEQGVKSGELTKGEAKRLKTEQRIIQKEKKIAKADGKVTPRERKIIRKDQHRASRNIHKLKHNPIVNQPK